MGAEMSVTIQLNEEPVEPLTKGNLSKADEVSQLRRDNWEKLPQVLEQDPAFMIGLRLRTTVDKHGLFNNGQRGVVTDIHRTPKKIYIVLTMDNEARTGYVPQMRTVKFAYNKLWKYTDVCH